MKIDYGITGSKRKELVGAIAQELNMPVKYMGAPTFAYEVGDYRIDKKGTLTGPDNSGLIADLQGLHSFVPTGEDCDGSDDSPAWHDTCDQEDRDEDGNWDGDETPHYLRSELVGEPRYTEEEFGLGVHRIDPIGENGMQTSDMPERDELVIEMPLTGFNPDKLDNLTKMVNAKAALLKASLGTDDLPIQLTENSIKFPWFANVTDYDMVEAGMKLLQKLCAAAKAKSRVMAKEKITDNPKYAMRCWLLSLGFIGDEYKSARKALLRNLEGNSAFKSGAPTKTEEVVADE